MDPIILVLVNASATAEQAARYAAALGAPLHVHLTLLNLGPTCNNEPGNS